MVKASEIETWALSQRSGSERTTRNLVAA